MSILHALFKCRRQVAAGDCTLLPPFEVLLRFCVTPPLFQGEVERFVLKKTIEIGNWGSVHILSRGGPPPGHFPVPKIPGGVGFECLFAQVLAQKQQAGDE